MKTAFVIYSDFTALDLIGPYEVIGRWPDTEVPFLVRSLDPVRCDPGRHALSGRHQGRHAPRQAIR